ncbi:carcinine transporter [Trichonephila clavipes]|nr:carcinine transporter [Trichonephila clavipes]
MDFEDILKDAGEFGSYQKSLLFKFMMPTTFASAFYVLNVIFMVATPDHWCYVPELASLNLSETDIKNVAIPRLNDGTFSKCTMYAQNYTALVSEFKSKGAFPEVKTFGKIIPRRPESMCSHGWEYQKEWYEETVVSKWDLVCDNNYLPSLVLTLANAGSVLGTYCFSAMADKCFFHKYKKVPFPLENYLVLQDVVPTSIKLFRVTRYNFIWPNGGKKHQRQSISLETKIAILDRLGKGEGSTAIGKHFNLGESTVRAIKKNEAAIRKSVISGTKLSTKFASYTRDVLLERTKRAIAIWIEEQVQRRIPVSGYLIQEKALQFYKSMKQSEPLTSTSQAGKKFSASKGWLTGFLKRNALHNIKITEESATANEEEAKIFPEELAKIIEDGDYILPIKYLTLMKQDFIGKNCLTVLTSHRMKKLQVDIKQVKIESPYYFVAMHQEIGC